MFWYMTPEETERIKSQPYRFVLLLFSSVWYGMVFIFWYTCLHL
jgi:hypothetical protein